MKKISLATIPTILATMLVVMPASSAFAQAAQHDHEQQGQKGGMKMDGMKMEQMQKGEMKMDARMMEQMAAKRHANTERIIALMAQVKGATGDAKIAAMADVIAVLVEERTAMHEHCASMMSTMPMMNK